MTELTEAELQKLNTGRMMRAESDLLIPLLNTKQAVVVGKIISSFKAGENDKLVSHAAELTMIYDMRQDINQKIKHAEYLEKKMLTEGEL